MAGSEVDGPRGFVAAESQRPEWTTDPWRCRSIHNFRSPMSPPSLPLATSFGLAVVIPGNEIGSLCFATLGYTSIDLSKATSAYNPGAGLVVTLPTTIFDPASKDGNKKGAPLQVTVNLKDYTVTAQ